MQAVVINEKSPVGFDLLENIKLNEIYESGIMADANKEIYIKKQAIMFFSFNEITNSETYIWLNNIYFSGETLNTYVYIEYYFNMLKKIFVSKEAVSSLSNIGFSKSERKGTKIFFNQTGMYSFNSIEAIFLPMGEDYIKQVEALKEDHLENVEEFTNGIRGTVNLKSNKIMLFSIPYSEGWTAYVNGKKTELLRANTMFMALPLKAGFYNIELRYFTPGLQIGIILSIIGFLLFVWIWKEK
jgi:uncharacterized membrane protein YfhO